MGKLTAAFVRSVTKAGRHGDGNTLFLRVTPTGTKSWIQRLTIEGKRHDIGLGTVPVIGLAEARERAFANRVAVAHGGNPLAEKRRANAPTFAEAAERTLEATRARWRTGGKTEKIWRQVLSQRALPAFGDRPVDTMTREDVLRIVSPIWSSKPEVARRLRQFVRSILSWAHAHGHVEHTSRARAWTVHCPPCGGSSNTCERCRFRRSRWPLIRWKGPGPVWRRSWPFGSRC